MTPNSAPSTRGPSTRQIRKSLRARESGEQLPGIDSTLQRQATPAEVTDSLRGMSLRSSVARDDRRTSTSHEEDAPSAVKEEDTDDAAQAIALMREARRSGLAQTGQPLAARSRGRGRGRARGRRPGRTRGAATQTSTAARSALEQTAKVTKARPAAITAKVTTRRSAATRASSAVPAPRRNDLLSILRLDIFAWPDPQPADFTQLRDFHSKWREQQDKNDAEEDAKREPDLDDWYEISGRPESYSENGTMWAFQYMIAHTFIIRAKRAYHNGDTWDAFEEREVKIDSESKAREITDPDLREIHMTEAVDNNLRLKILSLIRRRLCQEIWLQQYNGQWTYNIDENGVVAVVKVAGSVETADSSTAEVKQNPTPSDISDSIEMAEPAVLPLTDGLAPHPDNIQPNLETSNQDDPQKTVLPETVTSSIPDRADSAVVADGQAEFAKEQPMQDDNPDGRQSQTPAARGGKRQRRGRGR